MSQDVLLTVMKSTAIFDDSMNLEMKKSESCNKCLDLEAELVKRKNMVERDVYIKLSNSFAKLEKHCISLELDIQLNQQIFQKDKFCNNQNALEILEYFEYNDLKAQLQAKDTTICKLKEYIKSVRENNKEEKVKQEMDEIETINIELEHSVSKLLSENEVLHKEIDHLKKIYKDQFDSIKKTRALSKEHCESLIAQLNFKSMENADLKGQIQKKVFVTTALQNELRRLKEQENILRGIVEQAKAKQPLDNVLDFACKHVKRIQELLVYVRDTCPNATKPSEKLVVVTPINKVKKVRFSESLTSSNNIHKQVESSKTPDSNTLVLPSTRLKSSTSASRSQPTGNKKNDRISQTPSSNMKNKVEVQLRRANLSSNKKNRVKDPICDANVKHTMLNANSELICVVQIVLWYLDSGCSKHMTGNRSQLMNFVSKFLGTVRFENDQIAKIMGYGDYQLGNVTISRVYYVEGLENNLFSVGQFCDSDLEVAFRKNTFFIRNLDGVDLLSGSRDTNLYTISLDDMLKTSLICLLSKASKTKSWLWHRRLSHLNFGTLNKLAKDGLARGIPKLKFKKDHLCSACALGKSKKSSHQPKAEDTNQEKLYLLHMDLCGPMRVESINGKKYILVIVDDYSRFTWVKFLRSKDEAPDAIIKCIKNIQVRLNATVRNVRTDNGTEFVNQTLREFYENVGISHQTSVARTPQ
ncbi:retrovirus-related pol polyprotein from transposon TNT 1-94 [Tanacetum coccineum]